MAGTVIIPAGRAAAKATLQLDALRRNMRVPYLCYDCEIKGTTKFHFLGLECKLCKGFNTTSV
jgi:hypothetical protein